MSEKGWSSPWGGRKDSKVEGLGEIWEAREKSGRTGVGPEKGASEPKVSETPPKGGERRWGQGGSALGPWEGSSSPSVEVEGGQGLGDRSFRNVLIPRSKHHRSNNLLETPGWLQARTKMVTGPGWALHNPESVSQPPRGGAGQAVPRLLVSSH